MPQNSHKLNQRLENTLFPLINHGDFFQKTLYDQDSNYLAKWLNILINVFL